MSDRTSLHVHALTADGSALEDFAPRKLFSRRHVVKVNCKLPFSRGEEPARGHAHPGIPGGIPRQGRA